MKKIFIFILILGLFNSCCKECTDDTNPSCSNYNPCKNIKEPTCIILRCVGKSEIWSDSFGLLDLGDTFLSNSSLNQGDIYMYCPDTGCTYEWRIGSETITNQGFYRTGIPVNTPIEVTLKVTLKDPNNCIPIDKRTKNTKRTFYCIENYEGKIPNYYGRWKGYYTDEPSKEVIVEFKQDYTPNAFRKYSQRTDTNSCRDFTSMYGLIDTISNVPSKGDDFYFGRSLYYSSELSLIFRGSFGGEFRELNVAYLLENAFTKNVCKYTPLYFPSVQIYLIEKNKLRIDVQGITGWKTSIYNKSDILFKRTFLGSRI
jgi:hypothetical protein